MKEIILEKLNRQYSISKRDMSDLSTIKKGMYRFDCEAYEIKDIGNLFFIDMTAMFGLMKMETAVITPLHKDLSFCNFDIVKAMGNETYMFEMYRSAIKEMDLKDFEALKEKYAHLEHYETAPRWYDEWKLSSCLYKKGKKITAEGEQMMNDCLDVYLALLAKAKKCDPEKKAGEVRKYVDRLLGEGGAAVDSMNKIIGTEKTTRLVKDFMYGV